MLSSHVNNQYKYSDLTGKIIGTAIEVHKALGNGFQEVVYQRALAIEMREQGFLRFNMHEHTLLWQNR